MSRNGARAKGWPTGFPSHWLPPPTPPHPHLDRASSLPFCTQPGGVRARRGSPQRWLPTFHSPPAEDRDSLHLTSSTATLGPQSRGHVLRPTGHSATGRGTLQDAGQLAGAQGTRLRHMPGPYALPRRSGKAKLAMTGGEDPTPAPAHGRSRAAGCARQKSLGSRAQCHPSPIPVPAGPGTPPPPAAAPSLACAVPGRDIRLGLGALGVLGWAGPGWAGAPCPAPSL